MPVIILAVGGLGLYFLTGSHAASPFASLNADKGSLTCGATAGTDSTASDGSKVTFGVCNSGGGTNPACTTTVPTLNTTTTPATPLTSTQIVADAVSDVSGAQNGDVVCMPAGSYGSISLTGSHSGNVTFEPDPAQNPNVAGKVTFAGINISGTYITVHNFYSTNGITFSPVSSANSASSLCPPDAGQPNTMTTCHDTADHNDVTSPAGNYGIYVSCNAPKAFVVATVPFICSYINITNNYVHGTYNTSGDGDAMRLDGWTDVNMSGNEEYNNNDVNGASGHMDCLQSYNPNAAPENFTFSHNYIHDSNCEILLQEEIGNGANYIIADNLLVNIDSSACQQNGNTGGNAACASFAGSSLNINTAATPITMRNNTLVNTNGADINSNGSSTVYMDHNIFDQMSVPQKPATFDEDHNIFTAGNQSTIGQDYPINSTDLPQNPSDPSNIYGIKYSPSYKCGNSCGDGSTEASTKANDNYELVSLPSEGCMPTPIAAEPTSSTGEAAACVGIDWNPANQVYGPIN